jgi:hypothetical protein
MLSVNRPCSLADIRSLTQEAPERPGAGIAVGGASSWLRGGTQGHILTGPYVSSHDPGRTHSHAAMKNVS